MRCKHCGLVIKANAIRFPLVCICGTRYEGEAQLAGGRGVQPVGTPPLPQDGPGTELKNLLASIGITAAKDCSCKAMATKMNQWGPDGCRKNRAVIVQHLEKAAAKRGWAAKLLARGFVLGALVDRAISQAESRQPDSGPPA